jgi:malate synthase
VALEDGKPLSAERYLAIRGEELGALGGPSAGRLGEAADLLDALVLDDEFVEFLTLPAYERIDL